MADSLPTNPSNTTVPAENLKDPIIEEWILFFIPRGKRSVEFKFFKRKATKRDIISFTRQLCDRFGVRFIQVEPFWADIEELLKQQSFF